MRAAVRWSTLKRSAVPRIISAKRTPGDSIERRGQEPRECEETDLETTWVFSVV
jgi:hypothetical protein